MNTRHDMWRPSPVGRIYTCRALYLTPQGRSWVAWEKPPIPRKQTNVLTPKPKKSHPAEPMRATQSAASTRHRRRPLVVPTAGGAEAGK